MWQNKRIGRLIGTGVLATAILLAGCGKQEVTVAKYDNNKVITESQYKNYIAIVEAIEPGIGEQIKAGNKDALTSVLHYEILTAHIADQVKETDDMKKEAEANFKQFEDMNKAQLEKGKTIDQYYKEKNVTKKDVEDFFLSQLKLITYFSNGIPEADKKKEYEQAKAQGFLTSADVRHILISTEKRSKAEAKKKADALVKELRGGADFAKLAKENTDDPGSKGTGGLYHHTMEDFPLAQTAEAYRKAAMTLPLNKISDPIETEYGYHIMRIEKRTDEPYAKVEKDITRMLAQQKENDFYTNKLKGIIKEEKIPAAMIKEQPKQTAPNQPGQTPVSPAPAQQPAPKPANQ
ncbi:foldase protein PrsA [Aneurinibacillus soli]|uniref:Foldase protein PrsA 3 n=1 Tax=Aneurinibacillus soli TaxID=1500254 RepID=A0A0U5AZ20_9BACL|nr:peptidylprolyl isomerase [Aneurinibacillus soli]PYE58330.1 foldase protein PrsA [Aneurinibacillus soli]BAU26191.1 Foldase protein PrsA 3 precursor [Aneurinibacillus soli]